MSTDVKKPQFFQTRWSGKNRASKIFPTTLPLHFSNGLRDRVIPKLKIGSLSIECETFNQSSGHSLIRKRFGGWFVNEHLAIQVDSKTWDLGKTLLCGITGIMCLIIQGFFCSPHFQTADLHKYCRVCYCFQAHNLHICSKSSKQSLWQGWYQVRFAYWQKITKGRLHVFPYTSFADLVKIG